MGVGILGIGSIFLIELATGGISLTNNFHLGNPEEPFIVTLSIFIFLFLCVAIGEELFYRGYLLTNLSEGLNSIDRA